MTGAVEGRLAEQWTEIPPPCEVFDSRFLRQCGALAVGQSSAICHHEHVETFWACAADSHFALTCLPCFKVDGHACLMTPFPVAAALAGTPPEDEAGE